MRDENLDTNVVGMCTECKTTIATATMAKNVFAQQGVSPVCKLCGGVVAIIDRRNEDQVKRQMDSERGLG